MKWQHIILSCSILFFAIAAATDTSADPSESHCKCSDYNCGCCEYVNWKAVRLNGTVCTNFSYLPNDYGVSATLTWNNYTLMNETFSARNPPPLCFGIPQLEDIKASICIRLYDLEFHKSQFHGCGKLSIIVFHMIHKSIDLGCFSIPQEMFIKKYREESKHLREILREEIEQLMLWKKMPYVNMV